MMNGDHPYRILGITNERVGPFGLLGVSPERCDRSTVLRALRLQLARVGVHPDARTPEADQLRHELKAAADLLLDPKSLWQLREAYYNASPTSMMRPTPTASAAPVANPKNATAPTPTAKRPAATSPVSGMGTPTSAPRPSGTRAVATPVRPNMTPLQSELIAALVGSGGWNVRSRRRAVAIASRHGLTVNVLTSSLLSLSDLQTAVVDTTTPAIERRLSSRLEYAVMDQPVAGGAVGGVTAGVAGIEAAETDRSEPASTGNLAAAVITFIVCAVITIPIALFVLKEMVTPRPEVHLPPPVQPLAPDSAPEGFGFSEGITEGLGRVMPLTLSGSLDQLEEDLRLTDGFPLELQASYRRVIEEVRPHWIRLDDNGRGRVRDVVISSFYEKGTQGDHATLLLNLIDPDLSRTITPDAVVGRIWSTAMLMTLASETDLPAVAKEQVENRLRKRTRFSVTSGLIQFNEAAIVALDTILEDLVRDGLTSEEAVPAWLAWCDVLAIVATGEVREEKLFDAAQAVLRAQVDLRKTSVARQVLAGLLNRVDWSVNAVARRRCLSWYDEPRIRSADLAIAVGFLITQDRVPGIDETLALEPNANSQQRIQARERLASLWGGDAGGNHLTMDADRSPWRARALRLLDEPLEENHEDLFVQLIRMSRVNEAARYLEDHETDLAHTALRASTNAMTLGSLLGDSAVVGSRPGGNRLERPERDGEFAVRFAKATQVNDREGREELINELMVKHPRDLGPTDAGVLVKTALHGQPRVVREVALHVLETAYADGPRTMLILADLIVPDRADGLLSLMIARITGKTLPPPKSEMWYPEARLALLRHVQGLRGRGQTRANIEALSELLASSYWNRAALSSADDAITKTPAEAALANSTRWLNLARPMAPVMPVPGTLEDVERRLETRSTFSDDPIGLFAAAQMGGMETALYVTSAERPHRRDELRQILDGATRERARASSVLAQLIAVERAMIRVWLIRLAADGSEVSS